MTYKVIYSKVARKNLQKLPKIFSNRITRKIAEYENYLDPLSPAKQLTNFSNLFRYRIGNYRAVFTKDESGELIILEVIEVKHRKDVYKSR